jgi:hypothetical protein
MMHDITHINQFIQREREREKEKHEMRFRESGIKRERLMKVDSKKSNKV